MKRRITLVVDKNGAVGSTARWLYNLKPGWSCSESITIEKIEDLPDPPRVQEFRVRVETPAANNPWTREHVNALLGHGSWAVTVTEVDPS